MTKIFAKCPIAKTGIDTGTKKFDYINRRINLNNVTVYDINIAIFTQTAYPCIRFSTINKQLSKRPNDKSYVESAATLETIDWVFATNEDRDSVLAWLDATFCESDDIPDIKFENQDTGNEFDDLVSIINE